MTSPTHTVTATIATNAITFVPGTPGPSQVQVSLADSAGNPFGNPVIATGTPLTAVLPGIPDGTYTMTATTLDANGAAIPTTDASGNPVTASVTVPIVVTDPPVTLQVAIGITVVIS